MRLKKKRSSHQDASKEEVQVIGRLKGHRDGYGFVITEDKCPDIYINKRKIGDAMHGDRVLVRVEIKKNYSQKSHHGQGSHGSQPSQGADAMRSGKILKVLERGQSTIVGWFEPSGNKGEGRVIASDTRMIHPLFIPKEKTLSAKQGDIVSARIVRYPSCAPITHDRSPRPNRGSRRRAGERSTTPPDGGGEGEIQKIIGRIENPAIDTVLVAESYGLLPDFTPLAHQEAFNIPEKVSEKMWLGRVDLRSLPTVTIDGETARDFDDAVSIEREENCFLLWVHITDVSHFIVEGTALDDEARLRATSVYFPDCVYPMLPPKLSNGILSLNPQEDRLTLTLEMTFDTEGNQIDYKIYESVIHSNERMTYTAVHEILENPSPPLLKRYESLVASFKEMKSLALLLRKKRLLRGSLDFDLPEQDIVLDSEGSVINILKTERNIAHQLIEEFMLVANETVARHMEARALPSQESYPFLYRVHAPPSPERVAELNEWLTAFGFPLPQQGKISPKQLSNILEHVRGRPEEKLLNETVLRSMQKAVYSEKNSGHFGLASETYTHFTSPVRRYPDLIVHRLLKKTLGESPSLSPAERERWIERLPGLARHTSERERIAMDAERDVIKRKTIRFMEDKVGKTYSGRIAGVTSFGFFVGLDPFFVEGLVHLKTLTDDHYLYDEQHRRYVGQHSGRSFQLGDQVHIRVEQADLQNLEIRFRLTDPSHKR
jgi:ribonuclease R